MFVIFLFKHRARSEFVIKKIIRNIVEIGQVQVAIELSWENQKQKFILISWLFKWELLKTHPCAHILGLEKRENSKLKSS